MTALVFVDSNVLLHWRDASEPAKRQRAFEWMELLWRERRGRTSVQALNEFYVNAVRKGKLGLDPDDAWDDVDALLAWHPVPIDVPLMKSAQLVQHRHRTSWWDSLIVAAAQAQSCTTLLTEDLQHGARFGDLQIRSPFRDAVQEPSERYLATPARSRHPPRGRPGRATEPAGGRTSGARRVLKLS